MRKTLLLINSTSSMKPANLNYFSHYAKEVISQDMGLKLLKSYKNTAK